MITMMTTMILRTLIINIILTITVYQVLAASQVQW